MGKHSAALEKLATPKSHSAVPSLKGTAEREMPVLQLCHVNLQCSCAVSTMSRHVSVLWAFILAATTSQRTSTWIFSINNRMHPFKVHRATPPLSISVWRLNQYGVIRTESHSSKLPLSLWGNSNQPSNPNILATPPCSCAGHLLSCWNQAGLEKKKATFLMTSDWNMMIGWGDDNDDWEDEGIHCCQGTLVCTGRS